jgi:hypothetical protein
MLVSRCRNFDEVFDVRMNVLSAARRALLNVRSDQHAAVKGARHGSGLP